MVSGELLGPADLSEAQTFYIHEATKAVVIREDEHFMLVIFQVVAPFFESFNNNQKLTIVGLILYFRWNHFPWKERYWLLLAQIGLGNYPIRPSSGS